MNIIFQRRAGPVPLRITNVAHVPDFEYNLLPLSSATRYSSSFCGVSDGMPYTLRVVAKTTSYLEMGCFAFMLCELSHN